MASTGFLTAQTVMKEFPSTEELNQFEKERVKLSIFYARLAEECERKRRINEDELSSESSLDSMVNRAWAKLKESEERLDRVKEILSLKELDKLSKEVNIEAKTPIAPSSISIRQQPTMSQEDIIEKEQRADNIAYVTIKEEEEKFRRIAEESYLEEVEEEHRADNRAYATIKEEEEKIRRVAELSLKEEEETEYRAENKAYTIIQEEQERSRRIAEDSYLDELSLKNSLKNRKALALLEEQERSRRLRERPGASQLSELKVNAHIIATHCERFFSGKKPKVAKFSKPKKVRRNLTTELEEKERRRRIQNPPSSDQLNKLRVVSLNAALAKTQKTSGQDVVVNKFKKNVYFKDSLVRLQRVKQLEEEARNWKMSLKIPKEQKIKLMKVSIDAADRATKKFGSKNIIISKYKKPDQTIMQEEKERQRRLKEKLTTSQKDQLRKLSEMAADSAAKKISGRKLPISKTKVTKKSTAIIETRDQVKQAEEKERRLRMNNPLTPKQFLQLKAISNMAAQSANTKFSLKKKKRPALFKKPIAMKKDVTKGLEEQERQRRISEKPSTEQLSQLKNFSQQIADSAGKKLSGQKLETSKFKKTPVAAVETERKRRTLHKPELLTKLRSVAHNVKETVEAKLSGQKRLPSRFKKATLKGLDNTRKLEEEERQRRMTEKITPEQRNKLRIFSHEVVDQVVNKQRGKFVKPATFKKAQMKGFSKLQKLEEQERQRRISEKPSTDQLQKLKLISEMAAKATVTKQQQKKKPTFTFKKYKLTETVMRSRGLLGKMEENERQRRLANPPSSEQLAQLHRQSRTIVNEINKKLSGQKLQPVKFTMAKPKGKRLTKSAEHKKRHQFRLYQAKNFPISTLPISQVPVVEQKVTTTTKTVREEPIEVRKNVVEKLSHEMFSKITKAVIPERR